MCFTSLGKYGLTLYVPVHVPPEPSPTATVTSFPEALAEKPILFDGKVPVALVPACAAGVYQTVQGVSKGRLHIHCRSRQSSSSPQALGSSPSGQGSRMCNPANLRRQIPDMVAVPWSQLPLVVETRVAVLPVTVMM